VAIFHYKLSFWLFSHYIRKCYHFPEVFLFYFVFCSIGVWTQGLHTPWVTPPALFFCIGYFWDRVSRSLFAQGWLRTTILLLSASWVTRIIGMSHWHPAFFRFWIKESLHQMYHGYTLQSDFPSHQLQQSKWHRTAAEKKKCLKITSDLSKRQRQKRIHGSERQPQRRNYPFQHQDANGTLRGQSSRK
jgi:hypothetical protein